MDTSTILCRCEEITAEEIQLALQQGAESFDDVKRLTRCGMGQCQAKICRTPVSQYIADCRTIHVSTVPLPRLRMPLRPIPIGVLAARMDSALAENALLAEAEQHQGSKAEGGEAGEK
jgi:bacterioferritin-associated ferredoxin